MSALAAGLPQDVAGLSIDRQCAGGLDAISIAVALVKSGMANVVIAGGAESSSRRPERLRTDINGGPSIPYDRPPFSPWSQDDPDPHQAAADLAIAHGISKLDQDQWTLNSHKTALESRETIRREIVPLTKAPLDFDAFTRKLAMRTCERAPIINGTVSTATTAVSADAAAFVVVANKDYARRAQNAVLITGSATVGASSRVPGLSPIPAIQKVMSDTGLKPNDLNIIEMMEAYAVQAIACLRETDLDPDITNLGGGALARGHPIGASGAILAVRLYHELLERRGIGLAAIAAAGGIGSALILQA
jgi:acetyl-CoA C-acetyltransferase